MAKLKRLNKVTRGLQMWFETRRKESHVKRKVLKLGESGKGVAIKHRRNSTKI